MLNFKKIEIQDKSQIDDMYRSIGEYGSDYTFSNLFNWGNAYRTEYAIDEGFLFIRVGENRHYYNFPIGLGDLKSAVDKIGGHRIYGLSEKNRADLEAIYPGKFEYRFRDDYFDYIYSREKLATLEGKRLHGKRNHISHFKKNNPDWVYERIDEYNLPEVIEMDLEWCERYSHKNLGSLVDESHAVDRAFMFYKQEKLKGGLIRTNGRVVAFCFGSEINDDIFCVHVEKAFSDIQGAYPMINQQFALNELKKYKWVNREDDMGEEYLRIAKEEYYPDMYYKRYDAIPIK